MSWGKCVARCESLKFNLAGIDAEKYVLSRPPALTVHSSSC